MGFVPGLLKWDRAHGDKGSIRQSGVAGVIKWLCTVTGGRITKPCMASGVNTDSTVTVKTGGSSIAICRVFHSNGFILTFTIQFNFLFSLQNVHRDFLKIVRLHDTDMLL